MSDPNPAPHPADFVAACEDAIQRFRGLAAAEPSSRGELIPPLRSLLERLDEQMDELDIALPGFASEQGLMHDAWSALQSIDMDRGGPHVQRYVERAISDLSRVCG
jgi:hypothetical protein